MSVVRHSWDWVANLGLMSNDAAHRSGRGRSMRSVDEIAKARASGKPPLFLDETLDAEAKPLPVQGSAVIGHVIFPGFGTRWSKRSNVLLAPKPVIALPGCPRNLVDILANSGATVHGIRLTCNASYEM